MSIDLAGITQEVCRIAKETGVFIRKEAGQVKKSDIKVKFTNNLVSYVDTTAEKMIIDRLKDLIPQAGFIAEEDTNERNEKAGYQWIIDPLDGTTNFLHQLPAYAVSIALAYQNEILLGVVYEVNRSECFWAYKGGGAFRNGEAIQVSGTKTLKDSLLSTGFPYYDFEILNKYLELMKEVLPKTRGLRRLGAAAVDLSYIACGRFDAYWEYSLSPWDVAAGALIVREAGGKVVDFSGGEDWLFGRQIVAFTPALEREFMAIIQKYFL